MKTQKSDVEGRTALVTGGTRGIGFGIAEALLAHGLRVFICGKQPSGVEGAIVKLEQSYPKQIEGFVCNVGDYTQVQRMMQEIGRKFGGLDLLINNAGVGNFSNVAEMTPEQWRAVIDTNLSGVFYCCREAIPLMKKRGAGYIINIGSLAGRNYFPGGSAYSASKAGLIGFSEALMQEVRYDHIRVSYIMPGSVETEFGNSPKQDPSQTWKLLPEDVARVVVNLIESDPRSLSSRVEMRPSEPKR
jgi:3-oxoacyl-[acyl-carrier protein] reductase